MKSIEFKIENADKIVSKAASQAAKLSRKIEIVRNYSEENGITLDCFKCNLSKELIEVAQVANFPSNYVGCEAADLKRSIAFLLNEKRLRRAVKALKIINLNIALTEAMLCTN